MKLKKIICPNCGEVEHYGILERGHQYLLYNAEGESCGATDFTYDWSSTVQRCLYCNRKVKIVEVDE